MIVYLTSHNIFCEFCSFSWRSHGPISNLFKRKCFVCHFVLMVVWSSISASLILMQLVSPFILSRYFEINLQHLLWFVSVLCFSPESSSSLVNFVFFLTACYDCSTTCATVVCQPFMGSLFRLCLSLWFSIIMGLLNKNVALVSDKVHVPFLSVWFSIITVLKFLE